MKSKTTLLIIALAAFISGGPAHAAVTVQGWWHFDSLSGGLPVDSSGNGRNYQAGGIVDSGGFAQLAGALPSSEAAGGPLGTSGYTSTHSLRLGLEGDSDTFYDTGYVPPATNYGVEIWIKPQGEEPNAGGYWWQTDNEVWIFSSGGFNCCTGPSGGACVRVIKSFGGLPSYIQAGIIIGTDSRDVYNFGPQVPVDTNSWMHLALINTNGVVSFYTNGVLCAVNTAGNETAPAGVMHLGTDGAWNGFNGYIDEERVFTFTNASDFNPATDLLYSPTPRVIEQPHDTVVWDTGAATLQVDVSQNPCTQYQWYLYGTNMLAGASATSADLYLDPVALGDSGQWYNCQLDNSCNPNSVASSNAMITVVPVNSDNVNAYRDLVNGESSLLAYYPADGDTGSTLTDTKGGNNGTFQGGATFDSQTNRSFGARAVFIKHGNGDVQIPSNSAYEFAGGNGTVEALIYLMSPPTPEPGTVATIFSAAAADGSKIRYQLGVSVDGNSLVYTNDSGVKLTWPVPVNLLNRFAHVAFVFSGGTNVTTYVDGQSLGTLSQTGFGSSGVPCWIGYGPSLGAIITNAPSYWYGTIDELAIYGSVLSSTDIAIHNSKFLYGTNTVPPSIVSQTTGPKTLYAGGSPVLQAVVGGTPPFTYQWTSNGVAIANATGPTLTLADTTPNFSATYSLNVTNLYGSTNTQPIALTFINPPPTDPGTVAVMADHPTAFWPLNESSGPTAIDYAGGNNGTYESSGVTYGVPGPQGASQSAVSFDGAAGRVIVPYTPALNPSGPFTVEFWAQLNAYGFSVPISSMVRPARTGGYEFYLAGNYAGYEFHTAAGGNYNMGVGDGSVPPAGLWVHVAGVWDGTTLSMYINGYPANGNNPNFTNSNPPFVANASTPFYIGCRSTSDQYFNGAVSDVAFYNYALTQQQLSNHFAIGQPLKLAIAPSTNVIADTSPSDVPKDGMNQGATWMASASGRSGVMQFNATNANEIRVVAYPELAQTNLTIMFWMNSTGVVSTADGGGGGGYNEASALFFFRQPGTEGGLFIGLSGQSSGHPPNGIFVQGGNAGQGGVPTTIEDDLVVGDGTWHHIAITVDTSSTASNSVALFVDGNYRAEAFALRDWVWPGQNYTIQIGADNIGYDNWWNNYQGMLDDIRIYKTRLSASDIATAMGGGLINSNLVLRYNFDTAPGGYVVTWPYGNLLTAPSVAGPYNLPGGLTNTPPYPTRSPFPVSQATINRLGMQYFGGSQ